MSRLSSMLSALRSSLWRKISRILMLRDPRRDLSSILEAADPSVPLLERVYWIATLVDWLRGGAIEDVANKRVVRVRFMLQLLDRNPEWKKSVGATIVSVLNDAEAPSLFAQTELTEETGIISELVRRLLDRVIPPPPRPSELSYAVQSIFTDDDDPDWLEALDDQDWLRFTQLLESGGTTPDLHADIADAVVKVAIQVSALGFSPEIRARMADKIKALRQSPFFALSQAAVQWRDNPTDSTRLQNEIQSCWDAMVSCYQGFEKFGVSVPLILRLEKMNNLLYRIGVLIEITDRHAEGNSRLAASKELLIEIVRTHRTRQSILALFRTNFDIFSRKLVQHAGETGEHYITRTKKEYWAMFRAGAGGGIITVITTLAKFSISALKLPLFIEGIAVWINYSASFLTMQAFGFALATKQPSMTAAALAGRLSEKLDRSRLTEFVNEIARISRSQFIAAVGNVGLVIPTAFLVDFAYFKWSGNHVLSSYYAAKTLETLHPWKSATVLYAAFTGVLLWIASFGAGWLQNWVIYRQIPEAIASQRKLQVALGEKRAHALGEWVRHNAAGWGGNIAIGFLLAFVPLVGTVSGLPLDIRHVTLTAGTMTFAVSALDISMINANLIATCCLTVALIGLMNFSVSMACALIVAVRARRVRKVWFHALLAEARRFFLKRPLPFFFPTE